MSAKSANAGKHQRPRKVSPPERLVNQPNSFTPTRADLITSTPPSRDAPRIHTSVQRLDLSKEFAQPLPSPEYSSTHFPPSNHVNFRNIESNQAVEAGPSYGPFPHPNNRKTERIGSSHVIRTVPTYDPSSPQPRHPQLRVDPHGPITLPEPSQIVPTLPKCPPVSMTKNSDHLPVAASYIQRPPSPTPSGLPDYRSTYSETSHMDNHIPNHIPFAITNQSTGWDNQYTSYQPPSGSGSSRPSPHAQLAASSISHESRPPFQSSSKRSSYDRRRDSTSLSGYSGLSNSSISSHEGAFVLSDDYKRKGGPPLAENFVFPTSRSPAQPKISFKKKSPKSSIHSSKSNDEKSGRLRIIGDFFKKKIKGKNIPERQISEESGHEFTVDQEGIRNLKSSCLLDPYNPVLLDNDRYTSELLSRLNPTGSPSFHDYGTTPPSSVLDLGCGQGHWILEAAIAWKAYGTHITGYDIVDIPRNLLPWASEQGVRRNIRFVRGNFLKERLPFNSNTFDLVRMSCLALCITSDSWSFILQEVCRVLVAGGRLEFIDDQIFFPYGKVSSLMDIDEDDHGDTSRSGHKGKGRAKLSALSPEAWDRSLSISEGLEALFDDMLFDAFNIHNDPSDFILPLMEKVFGQAQEVETMNLMLAPPDSTAKSGRPPPQGLSHCPGLILWPSTFIPMDHTEIEIHASKHSRTLLSCKNFLAQHAIKVAELEHERVDEEFVSHALWEYESFLRHRFNPPVPASGSSVMPNELTHVRTFRVLEAIKRRKKLGLTFDNY